MSEAVECLSTAEHLFQIHWSLSIRMPGLQMKLAHRVGSLTPGSLIKAAKGDDAAFCM
jgi:hypothetical protein